MGLPSEIEIFFVFCLGLALGSFATAVSWRIPQGESWAVNGKDGFSRSRCTSCDAELKIRDLVPLFSWLFSRGKCRYCGKKIGVIYPLTELGVMAACFAVYMVYGFSVSSLIVMLMVPLLAVMMVVDIKHFILPNQMVFGCIGLAVIFIIYQGIAESFSQPWRDGAAAAGIGFALFGGLSWLVGRLVGIVLRKEALGLGDVKFFAMAGLWLGPYYLPFYLILSGVIGIFWGVLHKIITKNPVFPFGPSLILAFFASILLKGNDIIPFLSGY